MADMHKLGPAFLVTHFVAGALGGVWLLVLLLAFDVGGLTTLVSADPAGLVAVSLLAVGLCGTFGLGGLAAGLAGLSPYAGGGMRVRLPKAVGSGLLGIAGRSCVRVGRDV